MDVNVQDVNVTVDDEINSPPPPAPAEFNAKEHDVRVEIEERKWTAPPVVELPTQVFDAKVQDVSMTVDEEMYIAPPTPDA